MSKTPKYKAKHVYWDEEKEVVINKETVDFLQQQNNNKRPEHIQRFDSQHEFRVYLELVRMFGANHIVRQQKVQILPESYCYPKGKFWRADFAVSTATSNALYDLLVEAKGAFLPEFANILANLEQHNPRAFIRTFIVFTSQLPKGNCVIRALQKSSFNKHLLTFNELQQLKNLQ